MVILEVMYLIIASYEIVVLLSSYLSNGNGKGGYLPQWHRWQRP